MERKTIDASREAAALLQCKPVGDEASPLASLLAVLPFVIEGALIHLRPERGAANRRARDAGAAMRLLDAASKRFRRLQRHRADDTRR